MRKTKIVCTIGPATDSAEVLGELIRAGMNVARLNFSFGDRDYYGKLIKMIRESSNKLQKHVAILQDLAGSKVRVGKLEKPVILHRGEKVVLGEGGIPVSHPDFFEGLSIGDEIYLADGAIKLKVTKVRRGRIVAEVLEGGILSSHKGINVPNKSSELSSLTEKDLKDLEFGLRKGIDWVALSFVKSEKDVLVARDVVRDEVPIIAKIEKREAVKNLKRIIEVSDGVMIARGDLGVEVPVEDIPILQKRIIRICNELGKLSITATQMLKSMIVQPYPTRAEVTDVANAVLDGSDALMLSEETAVGNYPVESVKVMGRIIERIESMYPYLRDYPPRNVSESIAYSAAKMSMDVGAEAIITFTRTGSTAIQVSRYRPSVPTFAVTHDERTLRKLSLLWGCNPLMYVSKDEAPERVISYVLEEGVKRGILSKESIAVVTSGYPFGKPGTTNTVRVLKVGEVLFSEKEN